VWRGNKITRTDAVNEIVRRFRELGDIFEEKADAA
jgi:hypothetical protein